MFWLLGCLVVWLFVRLCGCVVVSGFVIVVAAVGVGVVACPVFMGISREFSRRGWDAGLEIRVLVRSETNRLTCLLPRCRLKTEK